MQLMCPVTRTLLDWMNNNLNCMKQDFPSCKNIALCKTGNSCFVQINLMQTLKIISNKKNMDYASFF